MTIPDEKEPPVPVTSTSPISPSPTDLNLDKPLPELNLHHKLSSPPKRKPLPIAKPTVLPNHDANAQTTDTSTSKSDTRRILPWLDWTRFSKRKRLVVVIGIVVGIILLALIIGLALGLTINKGYDTHAPSLQSNPQANPPFSNTQTTKPPSPNIPRRTLPRRANILHPSPRGLRDIQFIE